VWENDKIRFPRHYERFQAGQKEQNIGTPLSVVPWLTPSQIEEFKFFKIMTVEQLANLIDNVGGKFMGAKQFKQKAKEFLPAAAGQAPLVQMQAELDKRDSRINDLIERIAALEEEKED
jgi:predicted RecB family nuclease